MLYKCYLRQLSGAFGTIKQVSFPSRDAGRQEIGEQEKEVLEDELQQQMAYYEDL